MLEIICYKSKQIQTSSYLSLVRELPNIKMNKIQVIKWQEKLEWFQLVFRYKLDIFYSRGKYRRNIRSDNRKKPLLFFPSDQICSDKLLSVNHSRLILYLSCSIPGTTISQKSPGFLQQEMVFQEHMGKRCVYCFWVVHCFLDLFSRQS